MSNSNHNKTKLILKIVGIILLLAGMTLTVIGMVDFFITMANMDGMPTLFWMLFLGLPMLGIGGAVTMTGFRKEMSSYMMNETTPVFNEMGKQIAPGVQSISKAATGDIICPSCGNANDADATFCKSCATPLKKICPSCKAENDGDAKYCNKCATEL